MTIVQCLGDKQGAVSGAPLPSADFFQAEELIHRKEKPALQHSQGAGLLLESTCGRPARSQLTPFLEQAVTSLRFPKCLVY